MGAIETKWHPIPRDLLELFSVGMDRRAPGYEPTLLGKYKVLNLGSGYKNLNGADNLSWENGWRAPMLSDYDTGSVDTVFALHFLEHLDRETLMFMLDEIERVLRPQGVLNVVVPWYGSQLAYQDLDHKTFWTVETWKNLLDNSYYDGSMPRHLRLEENFSMIMGLSDRNLVVVSQLTRL